MSIPIKEICQKWIDFFLRLPFQLMFAVLKSKKYREFVVSDKERVFGLFENFFREDAVYNNLVEYVGEVMIGRNNQDAREEWLERTLREISQGSRILDAGAGELQYKKFCSHLEYVSQDFGQYDGEGDNHGLQMSSWDNTKLDIVSDITAIPVDDESFDAIMCVEVFEHISEPARAVKEFSRILKKGGVLVITAPFCSLTHFAPYHFSSGYNRYWYEKILAEYGFEIQEITPNGNYFDYVAQEIGRLESISEKYASIKIDNMHKYSQLSLLTLLKRMSEQGGGSSELLNYGFHVKAIKK